jgi:hypothetical protein
METRTIQRVTEIYSFKIFRLDCNINFKDYILSLRAAVNAQLLLSSTPQGYPLRSLLLFA